MNEKYKHIGDPAVRVLEECGELIQAVAKGMRFGWENSYPGKAFPTNAEKLLSEFRDLEVAFQDLLDDIGKK